MIRRILEWLFGPRHTVESVSREIIEGIDNGTVVLPWTEAEMQEPLCEDET